MNWVEYFTNHHPSLPPFAWEEGIQVSPALRAPLIHSLQRFQVGESGEGNHIKQGAAATGNPDYARSIHLFIAEEQQHSRWLGRILSLLQAPLLKKHWSDICFIALRRCLGLRQELMVLLVAEMIAKRYYRALYDGTQDPLLRAIFRQILEDEEAHLRFHIEYLSKVWSRLGIVARGLIRLLWRTLYRAACLVVIWDHRGVLKECRVTPLQFWWDAGLVFDDVASAIFYSVPDLESGRSETPVAAGLKPVI